MDIDDSRAKIILEFEVAGKLLEEEEEEVLVISLKDITERKQAEEELRSTELRYRSLIESVPDGVYQCTPDGRFLHANPGLVRMLGYESEEDLKSIDLNRDLYAHSGERKEFIRQLKRDGRVQKLAVILLRKDGHSITVLESAHAVKDAEGKVSYIEGIMTDITEQKEAEEALQNSEEKYRILTETSDEGIYIISPDGFEYVNPAFAQITGYTSEELLRDGFDFIELVHPEDRKMIKKRADARSKGHELASKYEFRLLRKDKAIRYLALSTMVFPGRNLNVMGIARDITERRVAEEQMRRLARSVEAAGEAIIMTDAEGIIQYVNPALTILTGYSAEEAVGNTPSLWKSGKYSNSFYKKMWRTIRRGEIWNRELTNRKKDGMLYEALLTITPVYSLGSELEGFVAVQRDITERRQLEREMFKSQRLESLGILAGGLAHDFNNFLTNIMLNVNTARLELQDNPKVHSLLTSAEQALTRAKGVTQQLLTFSRGVSPTKTSLYLSPLVKEAAKFSLHGTAVSLIFDLPDDLPPVEGDPDQLVQVINNLCLNAAQAMDKGGKLYIGATTKDITAEDKDVPLEPGKYIRMTVVDEGTGIPPEHLYTIFDPYFTTKDTGSGLGLASCFSIIKKHGGWITASNQEQSGACFTFYLPVSAEAPSEVDHLEGITRGTGRILVMDDEEGIRMGMAGLLQYLGYEVVTCSEGESAVKAFREADDNGKPFDFVILDLTNKKGMGGLETIKNIKKIDEAIKAIVCSGYSNDPVLAAPQKYGFSGVLPKPFGPETLKRAIDVLLPPDMVD